MNHPNRVVITGAAGQLGSAIAARFSETCEVFSLTRAELDIADERAVMERMKTIAPDAVINCAAYNAVDLAEDVPADAIAGNAVGVRALTRAAAETGATLVHYGTDFIFDGASDRPYTEDDPPHPLGVYGLSKLLGEWMALDAPSSYVLRVESLFGGHPAKSSIDKILVNIENGEPVRAFEDRTVTPSYVADVAAATEAILAKRPAPGVYHCVNSGVTTWVGVAETAARLLNCKATILPTRSDAHNLRARRPRNCALSNQKLASAGIPMPTWQEALERYVRLSRD
ncbi:MAG TPA: dTDP-4-dehydrorhamnose reductase [Vicinamibacterales bacterium]|jgi:dTDP-4-dehydrorhamnose reductase